MKPEPKTIKSIKDLKLEIEKQKNAHMGEGVLDLIWVLDLLNSFEAGLREKAPKAEYHDDLEHEWWSCSRCGLTGSEDEIYGHIAGWDCARELRIILGEGVPK